VETGSHKVDRINELKQGSMIRSNRVWP